MVEPARVPHERTDTARRDAAPGTNQSLQDLSDHDFEDILLKHAHPPVRDPHVWAELVSPALIERSRQTLIAMHGRNSGAIQRRKARLTTFQAQCIRKGQQGHEAWLRAKADYETWKLSATNFGRTVSAALAEVNDIVTLRSQTADNTGRLQAQLNTALNAIRAHRAACGDAELAPEPHDLTLWETLQSIAAGNAELLVHRPAVGR